MQEEARVNRGAGNLADLGRTKAAWAHARQDAVWVAWRGSCLAGLARAAWLFCPEKG